MEILKIGQKVNIKRSDGRVHSVLIAYKNIDSDSVTTEWIEGGKPKGKEVPLSVILALNKHLVGKIEDKPAMQNPSLSMRENESGLTYRKTNDSPNSEKQHTHSKNIIKSAKKMLKKLNVGSKRDASDSNAAETEAASVSQQAAGTSKSGKALASTHQTAQQTMRCSNVVREMERMKKNRERRRALQAEYRQEKNALQKLDPDNPNWEVSKMMNDIRKQYLAKPLRALAPHTNQTQQITVCVRKRPLNRSELVAKGVDIVTVHNGDSLIVHELRSKVDLKKYLEPHSFRFDYTFDETCSNASVYELTARPLIRTMFEGGNATCFAYGQTGSGKTHTMAGEFIGRVQDYSTGIYALAAKDVFSEIQSYSYRGSGATITCSFYELYGTKVRDLLVPGKLPLRVLEDGRQQVQVVGLTEKAVTEVEEVLRLIELGNRERTSGQTSANSKSSRSHAVFQMNLYKPGMAYTYGKCCFVDLAGNERGADTQSADRQTRFEGSEINKSLLALKECIRALSRQSTHLPFRGSKLTQVLRDSFIGGSKNKTCMIAMISPGLNTVEHTLNTLRYADRLKELVSNLKDGEAANDTTPSAEIVEINLESNAEPINYHCLNEIPNDDLQQNELIQPDKQSDGASNDTNYDDEHNVQESICNSDSSHAENLDSLELKLAQLIEQHKDLNEYMKQFIENFESLGSHELNDNPTLDTYLREADQVFKELTYKVNLTRDMMLSYNTQRIINKMRAEKDL